MARMIRNVIFGLLVAGLAAAAQPAAAQIGRCAPHDDLVSVLGENYLETQHGYGLVGPRAIVEVYVSDKGTWTILITGADGLSCILAVGIGWETIPPVVEETALAH